MPDDPLAQVVTARRKAERLKAKQEAATRNLEDAVLVAVDSGASYSAIGSAIGLSKQYAYDLAAKAKARRPTPTNV